MEIKIYTKNIELNPHAENYHAENYIRKKFRRLERHLSALSDAIVEICRTSVHSQKDRVVAQMTLWAGGYILRGQERGQSLFEVIDPITDVMDRQEIESDYLQPTAVVRTMRFPVKPMTAEDAVLEMELLSHNFFFFQQRRHRGVQHGIPQARRRLWRHRAGPGLRGLHAPHEGATPRETRVIGEPADVHPKW